MARFKTFAFGSKVLEEIQRQESLAYETGIVSRIYIGFLCGGTGKERRGLSDGGASHSGRNRGVCLERVRSFDSGRAIFGDDHKRIDPDACGR
jgi:hypothetical protein